MQWMLKQLKTDLVFNSNQ